MSGGVGGGWRVLIYGHGHRAKKGSTVGQKVTYNGPKYDERRAEKWRTVQNATLKCYNNRHTYASLRLDKLIAKSPDTIIRDNGKAMCCFNLGFSNK